MTTNQNRFNNARIYTIRCKTDDTLIYVGSTIQVLSKRWHDHKLKCNNEKHKDRLIYKTIRATGGIDNFFIELYENHGCNSKEELLKREGEVIRAIGTLNHKKYTFVENVKEHKKIYQNNHKEEKREYDKQYHLNNKEQNNTNSKSYYQNNKHTFKYIRRQLEAKLIRIWRKIKRFYNYI